MSSNENYFRLRREMNSAAMPNPPRANVDGSGTATPEMLTMSNRPVPLVEYAAVVPALALM